MTIWGFTTQPEKLFYIFRVTKPKRYEKNPFSFMFAAFGSGILKL